MKKYIVINTWNGEGYSDHNGNKIEIFDNKEYALEYAYGEATRGDEVWDIVTDDITNFVWTNDREDHGTFQVHPLPSDAYAVMIRTNVNEVDILDALEYANWIEELSSEFEGDYDSSEKEDYFNYEDNGDLFIQCFGSQDYDYQFRLIKNIKQQTL